MADYPLVPMGLILDAVSPICDSFWLAAEGHMPGRRPSDADIAKIIEDLLTIARFAMAPEVFAIDLNVLKAQALLAQLKREVQ